MRKALAFLFLASLVSLAACSKSEDAEVTAMKASIQKISTELKDEQVQLQADKAKIEERLRTISMRLMQMNDYQAAMDKHEPPKKAVEPAKDVASAKAENEKLLKRIEELEAKQKAAAPPK